MDVKFLLLGVISITFLSACEYGNSGSTVPYNSAKVSCTSTAVENRYVVKWKTGEISIENYPSRQAMEADLEDFSSDIEFVENDQRVHIKPALEANVETLSTGGPNWGANIVNAPAVWAEGIDGSGIIVAVVDTGIDVTHPQLAPQMLVNAGETGIDSHGKDKRTNGIDDDGNGFIDDVYGYNFAQDTGVSTDGNGHGTHVSGIIAANGNDGSVEGMAQGAKLLNASFMDSQGSGTLGDAVLAIQYAVSRGAKVINASWGGNGCSSALQDEMNNLDQQGVAFVVAAGNDALDIGQTPEFPAAFEGQNQITIGASGTTDRMASFSNFSTSLVHFLAPGVSIISTYPGNQVKSLDGTSMATPFAAGAVALLMSAVPSATVVEIKQALIDSVVKGNFPVVSHGRMDVKAALDLLRQRVP